MKGKIPYMTDEHLRYNQTIVAHDPHDNRHHGAVTMPIYQNSLFTFENYEQFLESMADEVNSFVYSRVGNPTIFELEKRLAQLEGGERARCFASGMAAISAAILSVVKTGDHIVCVNQGYGPAVHFMGSYLNKFQITTTFVDGTDLEALKAALQPNTSLLYLESPTSLYFELQDLAACVQIAQQAGIKTIIDNTCATPCFQSPIAIGIDLVVHSLTKYVSGHSDLIGGAVIGSNAHMEKLIEDEAMLVGGIMSPATASLMMRGLRTLPLRMEKLQENALHIARWLENLECVKKINHTGLPSHPQYELAQKQMRGTGSLFSFETDFTLGQMRIWADHLKYFRIGVSWGGYESLVTVHKHERESDRTLVRLYIGLEDPYLLIEDMKKAFAMLV